MSWFEPNIVYEGYGRAEFQNPKGYAEGPFKIEFDEEGKDSIEMVKVEKYFNESALNSDFDLEHLLTGITPTKFGGGWIAPGWPFPAKNTCTKVEVEIKESEGRFSCTPPISYLVLSTSFLPGQLSIKFSPHLSEFVCNDAQAKARFWVLPLLDFINPFVQPETTRTPHPLRIDPSENLIPFNFNLSPAFIDPLQDYEDRQKRLLSGSASTLLTAVMVGEINKDGLAYEQVQNWLPFHFLESVLSLATGIRVTTAWIEFRDQDRLLVKRIHIATPKTMFVKGHASLSAFHKEGIGGLLSSCQQSRFYGNGELRIVLNQLVAAGFDTRTVEERLSVIFRAFETLAELLEIKTSKSKELLSKENYDKVKQILEAAQGQIEQVGASIIDDRDPDKNRAAGAAQSQPNVISQTTSNEELERLKLEKERIFRIAKRMLIPLNVDIGFGEIVGEVIKNFGFADVDVILKFMDGRKWQQILTSRHRAAIMHGRSFKEAKDLNEGWRLLCHLQDLGIRAVLRLLNYEGTYCPVVAIIPEAAVSIDESLDWVNPSHQAKDLGYF